MSEQEEISRKYWATVQQALKDHGFDPGEINGTRGAMTDGALIRFKASRGLKPRAYIGPQTEAKLWAEPRAVSEAWPNWLTIAHKYLGLKEIPGVEDNPQIVTWWSEIGAGWFDDDETPWCGAFVGGTLLEAKIPILPSTQAPRARAWENWGEELNGPAVGAVVVFTRGDPSSGRGHVAFVMGKRDGRLVCLGGNQSNAVTVANFDINRVTAYRWPSEEQPPSAVGMDHLPVAAEAGHLSINEA